MTEESSYGKESDTTPLQSEDRKKTDMNETVRTVMSDGSVLWKKNKRFHHEDGPAITYPDGSCEWYHKGQKIPRLLSLILKNYEKSLLKSQITKLFSTSPLLD